MNSHADALALVIRQAQGGDEAALEKLLASYRNYLRLLARTGIDASLQGKADPSDLVQETLLKAYRRFAQFRGQTEAELLAWLRQIMVRNLTDLARHYFKTAGRRAARECSLEQLLGQSCCPGQGAGLAG